MIDFSQLPGSELAEQGLADYAAGRVTPESCLLAIGWTRLTSAGLPMPGRRPELFPEPELQLYALLGRDAGDAYARYNALLRRFISFENCLAQRLSR
jgi:hypothetical protein